MRLLAPSPRAVRPSRGQQSVAALRDARKCWGVHDETALYYLYVSPICFLFLKKVLFPVFLPLIPSLPGCHLLYMTWIILPKRECFISFRKPNVRQDLLSLLFGCTYHSIISHLSRQRIQNGSYDLPGHLTVPAVSVHPAETTRLKIIQLNNNSVFRISAEQMVKYPPFIIN